MSIIKTLEEEIKSVINSLGYELETVTLHPSSRPEFGDYQINDAMRLAKEYNKPVIFSAIGIEGYDEDNAKCQRLKKTLNYDNVRVITTRGDETAVARPLICFAVKGGLICREQRSDYAEYTFLPFIINKFIRNTNLLINRHPG